MAQHQEFIESWSSALLAIPKYLTIGVALSLSSPFDFVRIRMQTMQELIDLGKLSRPYCGIMDCCSRVAKEEGRKAFWKGNCSTLLKFYPSEGLNWTFKEFYQALFSHMFQKNSTSREFMTNYLGGALAGLTTRTLLYPLQFTRNKMSGVIQNKKTSVVGCLREALVKDGIQGIYRGAMVSFVGVALFRSTYFGIYDTFKDRTSSSLKRWMISYLATLVAISLTYPSDTVRRRMMLAGSKGLKYKGFIDSFVRIWRQEGVRGLYSGGSIIFFQSATGASIYFIIDRIIKDIRKQQL